MWGSRCQWSGSVRGWAVFELLNFICATGEDPTAGAGLASYIWELLRVLSREPTGAKWCFRNWILALTCSKEPPPEKALQWWESCEHTVPGCCCQADWLALLCCLGPWLLFNMALVSATQARASLISSLTLLFVRVSSLSCWLSQ